MKLGSMFKDVAEAVFSKPATQPYPFVRTPAPTRLRGKLEWDPKKCTGCTLCTRDCPADAIELVVNDKQNKVFVMRYSVDQCIYCGQCVMNCRQKSIELSNEDWELAELGRDGFTIYYGDEVNVKKYLEAKANPPAPELESAETKA